MQTGVEVCKMQTDGRESKLLIVEDLKGPSHEMGLAFDDIYG
jgi:hypothetical protein